MNRSRLALLMLMGLVSVLLAITVSKLCALVFTNSQEHQHLVTAWQVSQSLNRVESRRSTSMQSGWPQPLSLHPKLSNWHSTAQSPRSQRTTASLVSLVSLSALRFLPGWVVGPNSSQDCQSRSRLETVSSSTVRVSHQLELSQPVQSTVTSTLNRHEPRAFQSRNAGTAQEIPTGRIQAREGDETSAEEIKTRLKSN